MAVSEAAAAKAEAKFLTARVAELEKQLGASVTLTDDEKAIVPLLRREIEHVITFTFNLAHTEGEALRALLTKLESSL